MKKGVLSIWWTGLIVGFVCVMASPLHAGGIINKQNQSADYIRTLARNAATDAADIVVFNPAGVMKMQNGLYVKADVMYFAKDYSNQVPGFGTLDTDEPSVIPAFFALYKLNKWAAFSSVTIPGGGGKVKFNEGNARTVALSQGIALGSGGLLGFPPTDMSLRADSFSFGYSLGAAYNVNDILSVAGGIRYVDAYQKFKGFATLPVVPAPGTTRRFEVDLERDATGWSHFLGLNAAPTDRLNFGFLYLSNTNLNYKSDVKRDDTVALDGVGVTGRIGWQDGTHQREDLPGLLGFGLSYKVQPQLRVEVNYTYYLEKAAKLEEQRFKEAGDSWDLGLMVEYTFSPQWKFSLGYLRSDVKGMSPENMLPEAPELDANTLGGGVVWSPTDRWALTLGALKVWYDSVSVNKLADTPRSALGTSLDKDIWSLAFGVQYRFF